MRNPNPLNPEMAGHGGARTTARMIIQSPPPLHFYT